MPVRRANQQRHSLRQDSFHESDLRHHLPRSLVRLHVVPVRFAERFDNSDDIPSPERFGDNRLERPIGLRSAECDLSGGCIDPNDFDRSALPARIAAKDRPRKESQGLHLGGGAAYELLKA